MLLFVKWPLHVLINASFFQAIESAQAAQDVKIRFDSFQQQFQEVLFIILTEHIMSLSDATEFILNTPR